MSWTGHERARARFIVRALGAAALALALVILGAGSALAVGPFAHLSQADAAWPAVARALGLDPAVQGARSAFLAGVLAPDAGYYPGAEANLARAAHLARPWEFCRALLAGARGPVQRAFAAGWAAHMILDASTHAKLVNPLAGGTYSQNRLRHKQVEWGLDCALLAEPARAWLWSVEFDAGEGLKLWGRVLEQAYGKRVGRAALMRAMAAEAAEVERLPYVWWLSGQLRRPGRWAGNALGAVLGATARPAYLAWLRWTDGGFDVIAVLSPRPAEPKDLAKLGELSRRAAGELVAALTGGPWPASTPDADPGGERGPDAKALRAWLEAR